MHLLAVLLSSILLEYVNPFMDTDGQGRAFPGAAYPFGMVQAGPVFADCQEEALLCGFSHTRFDGKGFGDMLLMPVTDCDGNTDLRSCVSEVSSEQASPAYYSVFLDRYGVDAKMTVGRRVAMHEYTYPRWKEPQLIVNMGDDGGCMVSVDMFNPQVVHGYGRSSSWGSGRIYFHIEFSDPVLSVKSEGGRALLTFRRYYNNVVRARVSVSCISEENARLNMLSEQQLTFDEQKRQTERLWERFFMERPCRDGGLEQTRFHYTRLYHNASRPSLYSDYDGTYRAMDGSVRKAVAPDGSPFEHYTVNTASEALRSMRTLLSGIYSVEKRDFMLSFRSIFTQNLPAVDDPIAGRVAAVSESEVLELRR